MVHLYSLHSDYSAFFIIQNFSCHLKDTYIKYMLFPKLSEI
jgi:hypothetical protein